MAGLVTVPLVLVACSGSPDDRYAEGEGAFDARLTGLASLATVGTCEELLAYFRDNARERVTAWGLGQPSVVFQGNAVTQAQLDAAVLQGVVPASGTVRSAGQHTSTTNNQVEGVDEADVVKTDGSIVVAVVAGGVRIVDASTAESLATVDLPADVVPHELLLADSTLLVLGSTDVPGGPLDDRSGQVSRPAVERTVLTQVDLTDPGDPAVGGSTRIEGSYRSARLVGSSVRLVMASTPAGLDWVEPETGSLADETEALEENRRLVDESTLADWVPQLSADGGPVEPLLPCDEVGLPADFSGFSTVSVATLDLTDVDTDADADVDADADTDAAPAAPRPSSAAGVVGGGETVFASADRVVVATAAGLGWGLAPGGDPWGDPWGDPLDADDDATDTTDLHVFEVGEAAAYLGSGRVEGHLLSQMAIDAADGVVRVATTRPDRQGSTSSSVVVLEERPGEGLVETGRVDGLGPGEQVRAVRFLSPDLAAVVTFRQVDPLYLVDTRDPSAPTLAGELKVPGYSAYLHPLPDGRLLGIGQDADTGGGTTGLQASLFDVSDPTSPQRVATVGWPGLSSAVETDHRAFLLWQDRVYLTAGAWTEASPQWLVSAHVDGGESGESGESGEDASAVTPGPTIDLAPMTGIPTWDEWSDGSARTLVVGDRIWVVDDHRIAQVAVGNREIGVVLDF